MSSKQAAHRVRQMNSLTMPAGLRPVSIARHLQRAQKSLRIGRLSQTEYHCRQILGSHPDQPNALNLLGVVATLVGRAEQALPLIQRAIAARDNEPSFHFSLANAFKALGQLDHALEGYRRALALKSNFVEAAFNLANVLKEKGRTVDAVQAYRKVIEIQPNLFQAHANLGHLLQAQHLYGQAVAAYRAALEIEPNLAPTQSSLGNALLALDRHEEALAALRRAIELDSEFAVGHYNLGAGLQALSKNEDAIDAYGHALAKEPGMVDAHYNLGCALETLGRLDEAARALEQAISLNPDHAQAQFHLCGVLVRQGDSAGALALCDGFLQSHPRSTSMLAVKSVILLESGEREAFGHVVDFDRLIRARRFESVPGFENLSDFNRSLTDHVISHPALVYELPGAATSKGWHSGMLTLGEKGPVAELERMIEDMVLEYCREVPLDPAHPFLASRPERWRLSIWAIVLDGQGHQVPHIHPSSWLSGVYYAAVPAFVTSASDSKDGWIEFGQPKQDYNLSAKPELRLFCPEEGLLLLFPSYFYHRTVPFDREGRRISLAFDVIPED